MSKKMLRSVSSPDEQFSETDFLVIIWQNEKPYFWGTRSKKIQRLGQVVYVGIEVSANDVFAKLVDSGIKIEDVEKTLDDIKEYLNMVKDLKIGSVVQMMLSKDLGAKFRLQQINIKRDQPKKLP